MSISIQATTSEQDISDTDDHGKQAASIVSKMIRARRRDLNMTQAQVASQMGVTRGLVAQWESGRSRIVANDIERLAAVLQTTSARLFGEGTMTVITRENGLPWDEQPLERQFLLGLYDAMSRDERSKLIHAAMEIAKASGR